MDMSHLLENLGAALASGSLELGPRVCSSPPLDASQTRRPSVSLRIALVVDLGNAQPLALAFCLI